MLKKLSKPVKIIINIAVPLLIALYIWYFDLPAISFYSRQMWNAISILVIISLVLYHLLFAEVKLKNTSKKQKGIYILIIAAIPVLVIILNLASSTFFNAVRYSEIIEVKDSDFEKDMPMSDASSVSNIALMDTTSAIMKGNTTLGSLSELVSQFSVSQSYTQINYQRTPQKVSNLEYDGFFKWINNKDSGIPGFVMVDPVNNAAKYISLDKKMKYVESGYFGDDLMRKLRFSYPTKLFNSVYFEIDDNGNPYFIVSCVKPKIGLFGAMDVDEVIIFDPVTGDSKLFNVKDTPAWIDVVYTGDLACRKYDWYGTLSGGFWNSVIGNKGCKKTTDDYGYIVIEDDVWYFTGVTSVTSDTSNIGFMLSNARTGEYKFYSVVGAEEHSAMNSAQGQVQEKGYVASFPSLINAMGQATYIMVLKDANLNVKLYALVNVQNYSLAATGDTQIEAFNAYKKLLSDNGIVGKQPDTEKKPSADITVDDVRIATVGGETIVYITAEDGKVYKGRLDIDESLVLVRKGDKLKITYTETDIQGLNNIVVWEYITE